MSLSFAELLPLFLYPLNLSLTLAVLAALLWRRQSRTALALLVTAISLLWMAAMPIVAGYLLASLEWRHLPVAMADIPATDAIVVLGGAALPPIPPRLAVELHDASDRVLHALRLYRADKAPVIIISGDAPGEMSETPRPGYDPEPAIPAAEVLLREWGVPAEAILAETASRSTRDNAMNIKRLANERGFQHLLLVTSALHMPRALAAFKATGLQAVPAPTDYHADYREGIEWRSFLPYSGSLAATTACLREYLSLLYYGWRGWL